MNYFFYNQINYILTFPKAIKYECLLTAALALCCSFQRILSFPQKDSNKDYKKWLPTFNTISHTFLINCVHLVSLNSAQFHCNQKCGFCFFKRKILVHMEVCPLSYLLKNNINLNCICAYVTLNLFIKWAEPF